MPQGDGSNGRVGRVVLFPACCVRSDAVSRLVVVASALGSEEIGIVGVRCLGFFTGLGSVSIGVYDETIVWRALCVEDLMAGGFGKWWMEKYGRAVCVGESASASASGGS